MTDQYIEDLKRRAKKMSAGSDLSHQQALDAIAKESGHSHWGSLQKSIQLASPKDHSYKSRDRFILSQGLSVAQQIEALIAEAYPTFRSMIADLPPVPVEFFIETSWMDFSFGSGLKESGSIPTEARVLQEKFIELASHLHTITQETRVFNLFYRADGQGDESVGIHLRLHGCIYWTSVRLAHGFHHSIEATGSPLAHYLPDVPGSWQAAHNWAQSSVERKGDRDLHLYRGFDPIDLGFEPCGLTCRGGSVYGATYKVRDRDPDEYVEELADAITRIQQYESEFKARQREALLPLFEPHDEGTVFLQF